MEVCSLDDCCFFVCNMSLGEVFFHLQREKRLSEERAKFYAAEITSALGFLHSLNIVYRFVRCFIAPVDSECDL